MTAPAADKKLSNLHVLDFWVDDEGSCAVTAYHSEQKRRYHIIADKDKLQPNEDTEPGDAHRTYAALRASIRKHADGGEAAVSNAEENSDEEDEDSNDDRKSDRTRDSGIDVNSQEDAEEALQKWMLQTIPIDHAADSSETPESNKDENEKFTLSDYYHTPTTFYNLELPANPHISTPNATELEPDADFQKRMKTLIPDIAIPKSIQNFNLPWYSSRDLTILASSSFPPPYHPTLVRTPDGETLFFKAAMKGVPQVTKRELTLLKKVEKIDAVRAPTLRGLVSLADARTRAIGFLQSTILDPTPLTHKLDASVPQDKRERWAAEAEAMKEALHRDGIVWGDAKADNFLVDVDDTLWMIDFGGGHTEGWVDERVKETEEGDDMGTKMVVEALKDPVGNVEGGGAEDQVQVEDTSPLFVRENETVKTDEGAESEKSKVDNQGGMQNGKKGTKRSHEDDNVDGKTKKKRT